MTSRFTLFGLFTLLPLTVIACSGDDTSIEDGLDDAAIADLEERADRLVAAGVPGVSIAVMQGAQTELIARGVADLESGAELGVDHRFRVASTAKSVVASVVLQLVDEGEIELSDTVEAWLPGMVSGNSHATIENLLRLESGIFDFFQDERVMAPYFAGDFEFRWEPEQLVAIASEHAPMFAPGSEFYYSNTNYVILGLIVEKITGEPLADVARERIFEPLGMASSSMENGSHMDAPYSHGYLVGFADEPVDVTAISASHVFGNGNLISTALDLAKFYRALARGEVVSEPQLGAMFALDPNVPDTHYAMGVWRWDESYPCHGFIGHDGAIAGYDTTAFSSLDGTRQYAVLTSSLTMDDKVGDDAAQAAFKALVSAAACN